MSKIIIVEHFDKAGNWTMTEKLTMKIPVNDNTQEDLKAYVREHVPLSYREDPNSMTRFIRSSRRGVLQVLK